MSKPFVSADASFEEIEHAFYQDRYVASSLAAVIEEARCGFARVSMEIADNHLNGMGALMGGVPFTLADYTFGVAANIGQAPTVTASSTIDFMGTPKDGRLIAECEMEKSGRSLCFATVHVTDGLGNAVARVLVTGFRK